MDEQTQFNFEAPFAGRTPASKHASWTGARQAVKTWGPKVSAYLQILKQAGSITDQEAAPLVPCALSSINSIRNSVKHLICSDGHEIKTWPGGGTTSRTRWRLR
jgi:hypothetical protein